MQLFSAHMLKAIFNQHYVPLELRRLFNLQLELREEESSCPFRDNGKYKSQADSPTCIKANWRWMMLISRLWRHASCSFIALTLQSFQSCFPGFKLHLVIGCTNVSDLCNGKKSHVSFCFVLQHDETNKAVVLKLFSMRRI